MRGDASTVSMNLSVCVGSLHCSSSDFLSIVTLVSYRILSFYMDSRKQASRRVTEAALYDALDDKILSPADGAVGKEWKGIIIANPEKIAEKEYILDVPKVKRTRSRQCHALPRPAGETLFKTSKKSRRSMLRHAIVPNLKYNDYAFLNDLWKQYAENALKTANRGIIEEAVAKLDLHGSIIHGMVLYLLYYRAVDQSNAASYVDTEGLVIQETGHMLRVLTKSDRPISIPKKCCTFSLMVPHAGREFRARLYGPALLMRPFDRSTKKFKCHSVLKLGNSK